MRLLTALLITAFTTASALSEQVKEFKFEPTLHTKNCGNFKLLEFKCDNVDPPQGNIREVCYHENRDLMVLMLSRTGGGYCYCGLGAAMVNEFLDSTEMERFYKSKIKGRFRCRHR